MAGVTPETVPIALIALGAGTLIMWLAARIVAVPRATLFRSFLAMMGVSLIMGAVVTAWAAIGSPGLVLVGAGVIGSIILLMKVFEIPATPAVLIFLVNVAVQVLFVAMWLRPFVRK